MNCTDTNGLGRAAECGPGASCDIGNSGDGYVCNCDRFLGYYGPAVSNGNATCTKMTCTITDEDSTPAECGANATCDGGVENGYICDCSVGYSGSSVTNGKATCLEIDECETEPCLNNGTCIDEVNGYKCQCAANYYGTICDREHDDCGGGGNASDALCTSNGTCVDIERVETGQAHYRCACDPGWTSPVGQQTCSIGMAYIYATYIHVYACFVFVYFKS